MLNVAASLSRGYGQRLLANAVRKIEEEGIKEKASKQRRSNPAQDVD